MKPHQLKRALKRITNKCPKCGGPAIEVGPIFEEDADTLARYVDCRCGFEWYERYALTDAKEMSDA